MEEKQKNKLKMPDAYVILFIVLIITVIATYIVPAGLFDREIVDGVERVIPGTFEIVGKNPTGLMDIFLALQNGMIESAAIIFLILFAGGMFEVLDRSGALKGGLSIAVDKTRGKEFWLIAAVTILFALGGAVGAVANTVIPFVAIGVMLARQIKLDAIVAVAITFGATFAGFNVGFINPFTVGIAQDIAGLPLFSGLLFRIIVFIIIVGVTILYIWNYSKKILKDPSKSLIGILDDEDESSEENPTVATFTTRHKLILIFTALALAFLVFATIQFEWSINHMAAFFVVIGLSAGVIAGMDYNKITEVFIEGCKNLVYGALIVGVARAILIVMENGLILDSLVNALSAPLEKMGPILAALGMFFANAVINFFVNSGSGQAMIAMPILTPLADTVGVNRQIAVQAYQFGDGFTNIIFPTSGILMASLAIAGVSWAKWARWVLPLLLIWVVIGITMLIVGVLINWGPF